MAATMPGLDFVLGVLDERASFCDQMRLFLLAVDRVTEERS